MRARFVRPVLVGMPDDQARGREHENGDVTPQFVSVEGCFVMDHVGHERFAGEGSLQCVCDEGRVVPAALDIPAQLAMQGSGVRHGSIIPSLSTPSVRRP